jgi:hypothetical protein
MPIRSAYQDEEDDRPFQVLLRRLGAMTEDEPTPNLDRFQEHLGSFPERQPTGFLQKLLYSAVGAGQTDPAKGIALAEGLRDRPYKQALEDWVSRGKGLEAGADVEERINRNRGTGLKRYADVLFAGERAGQGERRTQAYIDSQRQLGETRQQAEARLQREAEDRMKDRQVRQEVAREGLDVRRQGVDIQRQGLDLRKKDTESRIANRGGSGSNKITEDKIHAMAVGNVLRDNPAYADVVDRFGNPQPGSAQNPLTRGFSADLERQKMILRNRYLGSDLQRPVFALDQPEEVEMPEDEEY